MMRQRRDSGWLNKTLRWTAPLYCTALFGWLGFQVNAVIGVAGTIYGIALGVLVFLGNFIFTPNVPADVDEVVGSRFSHDEHMTAVYVDYLLIVPQRTSS